MNKVYVYVHDKTIFARLADGELVTTFPVQTERATMVKVLKERGHEGKHMVWVVDVHEHPVTAKFIAPADPEELPVDPAVHLCDTCVHQNVCIATPITEKIQLTINQCDEHVAFPEATS